MRESGKRKAESGQTPRHFSAFGFRLSALTRWNNSAAPPGTGKVILGQILSISLVGLCGMLVVLDKLPMATAQSEHAFPYLAYVMVPEAQVHSGPGQRHYPTASLPAGFAVQVYRHDPEDVGQTNGNSPHSGGTWCAIRPPEGSVSWVESHQIRKLADSSAEILGDQTVVRVGSRLSASQNAVQVLLTQGELVKLAAGDVSVDGRWLAIEPPAGEFRWILASQLSQQPPAIDHLAGDSPSPAAIGQSPWKSQREARRVRQARKERQISRSTVSLAVASSLADSSPIRQITMASPSQGSLDESIHIIAGSPADMQLARVQPLSASNSPSTPITSSSSIPPTSASTTPPNIKPRGSYLRIPPRIHFLNQTANLANQTGPASDQKAVVQTPGLPPKTDPLGNSTSVQNQIERLGELQVRLSQMVVQDPTQWQFEQIRHEADTLLTQAEAAAVRERTRDFLDQLTLFERVRSRRLDPANTLTKGIPGEDNQTRTLLAGQEDVLANPTAAQDSSHQRRQFDLRQRAREDLKTGRFGRDSGNHQVATLEETPDTVRYDAVGLLKPVVSRRDQSPRYALVDDEGKVVSFLTPTPDVNLQPYIGRRIGVNGKRGFMPEYRRAHVTASHITPLMR